MITRARVLLIAGILGLVAFAVAIRPTSTASVRTKAAFVQSADSLAWVSGADLSELTLKSKTSTSDGSTVLESQDAVDCAAGGWRKIISGYPYSRCCVSTERWVKYVGVKEYYKCCGRCPM